MARSERRRSHFWDYFFLLSYPPGIGSLFLVEWQTRTIGGSAYGGRYGGGQFFVITDSDKFVPVEPVAWITNIVLTFLMVALFLVMIAGIVYFFVRYFLPYVRSRSGLK